MLALLVGASAAYSLFPMTQPRLRAVPRLTSPAIADVARHEYLVGPVDVGCASASLELVPELALPRMNVVAKQPPLTDDAIEEFLAFIGKCLDRDEAFTVLWHVKGGAFPSMKQVCAAHARPSDTLPAQRIFLPRDQRPCSPLAPLSQFRRVLSWLAADGHAEAWDANVQGNVAVIRSPLLRGVRAAPALEPSPPLPPRRRRLMC